MKKNHIFLDTNIIQHTLMYSEKEKLIGLHQLNADFYDSGNLYLLPQVQVELSSHNLEIKKGNSQFIDIYQLILLDDTMEFHLNFINNIFGLIYTLGLYKPKGFNDLMADAIFYLENMYQDAPEFQSSLSQIKKFTNSKLGINHSHSINYKHIGIPLSNIVEGTGFGDIKYRGFTYRDIFRSTGNFMFDYKNYQNKGERQKGKVGKDAQVICELVLWMDYLKTIPIDKNIVFIASDYDFIKEIRKFQNDCIIGNLLDSEYYKGLSSTYITQLMLVMRNLKVIKLDPVKFLFENEVSSSYKIVDLL